MNKFITRAFSTDATMQDRLIVILSAPFAILFLIKIFIISFNDTFGVIDIDNNQILGAFLSLLFIFLFIYLGIVSPI